MYECGVWHTQYVPFLAPIGGLVAVISKLSQDAKYNKAEAEALDKQVQEVYLRVYVYVYICVYVYAYIYIHTYVDAQYNKAEAEALDKQVQEV